MKKIKELYNKYSELITYIFFGGLTTAVNYVAYVIAVDALRLTTNVAVIAAWVISVAFAFVTNKIWVFKSRAAGVEGTLRELLSFVAARLLSLLLDMIIMNQFADKLGYNDKVVKVLSNILVIIVNYILSKWIIFKKKGDKE